MPACGRPSYGAPAWGACMPAVADLSYLRAVPSDGVSGMPLVPVCLLLCVHLLAVLQCLYACGISLVSCLNA